MINKITFTGREEMLIDPLKVGVKKVEQVVTQCDLVPVFPKTAQRELEPALNLNEIYTNPFAPIPEGVGEKLRTIV